MCGRDDRVRRRESGCLLLEMALMLSLRGLTSLFYHFVIRNFKTINNDDIDSIISTLLLKAVNETCMQLQILFCYRFKMQ